MASDLSSGCTDDIEIFDEKEEGEISLEDVSSSEESHPNYRSGFRNGGRCPNCMSHRQCSPWCNAARIVRQRSQRKRDADHGKENRRHAKDSSGAIVKHVASTLQEKNDDDDLVPISSDSDMEIVGLPGNSKQVASRDSPKSSKVRKKKRKKRNHGSVARIDDSVENEEVYDLADDTIAKVARTSRSHHRESISPRYSAVATAIAERTILRSPSRRYRTAAREQKIRSPLRRTRSPVVNPANPTVRKLSRKLRSSRRAPPSRSPVRFALSRESRDSASSPAHVDIYATKLLKKVRRLESVGTFSPKNKRSRSKERSSLKEKLSNMMRNKETSECGEKIKLSSARRAANFLANDNNNVARRKQQDREDTRDDEDDDIELLRRLALETKQKKTENKTSERAIVGTNDGAARIEINLSDDNDSEALELRMIALHSAVMKKHQNRVERGIGSKKRRFDNETRNESPFSMSFLDGIPIPDELSSTSAQSRTAKSPARDDETNNPEDMDLDTDVEREKDSMPYSPTDYLTIGRINVENEAPIVESREIPESETIDAKNVSPEIINSKESKDTSNYRAPDDTPYSPSVPTITPLAPKKKMSNIANETERPYSPERSDYASTESLANYMENPDSPYSSSKSVETSKIEYLSFSPSKSITGNIETPYSPTDTPIYDPELTRFSPDAKATISNDFQAARTSKNIDENSAWDGKSTSSKSSGNLIPMMLNMSMNDTEIPVTNTSEITIARNDEILENSSITKAPVELSLSEEDRMKSYEAIMDELPEIDLDGSPLVQVTLESSNNDIEIPLDATDDVTSLSSEPLYLQGLPDVTRDTNKIPTLVNRTLVPAPILKTNKHLQQPLPPKKLEIPAEPSFKSADMRPVSEIEITGVRPTKIFKPIKLCPVSKKSQIITTTTSAAFNLSLSDDTTVETLTNNDDDSTRPISGLIKDSIENTESAIVAVSSASSSTTEQSRNIEKSGVRVKNCSVRKSTLGSVRSKSPSPDRSRITSKAKAKSVEACYSNASAKRVKSTSNRTARRASSSSIIDKRLSRKNRPNEDIAKLDSSTKGSKKMPRSDSIGSSSEANASKNSRRISTNRGGRKIRARRQKARNIIAKVATSRKHRRSGSVEKSTSETTELDDSTDSRVVGGKSTDTEMRKSPEFVDERTSARSSNDPKLGFEAEGTTEELRNNEETEKNRRCSMDDDEEALRALLLASLPKRAKIVEASAPGTLNPIVKVTRLSDTTITDTSVENLSEKLSKDIANNDSSLFATPRAPPLSSQSSSPASNSLPPSNIDTPDVMSKHIDLAEKIPTSQTNVNFSSSLSSSSSSSSLSSSPLSLTSRKRPGSVITKSTPKKIAKKALPVLASTKVVNNAKKYQNAMLQKRLNLQRAATLYSATNGSRNITLNNLKTYENSRPSSPKITNSSSKTQRLVISLESDTDSEAESPSRVSPSIASCGDTITSEQRKPLAIPTTDFEKSVVQFLKDQRKKMESIVVTTSATSSTITTSATKSPVPSSSTAKVVGIYSTPLAVRRHLPVSQQEEYRRLKQQIMERERQMLKKTIENGTNLLNSSSKSPCTPPGPLSPASPIISTLATKLTSQRLSTQATSTIVASNTDKSWERSDENFARINVASLVKPHVSGVVEKTLLKSVPIASNVASRISNISKNSPSTSTNRALGEISKTSSITKISSPNSVIGKNFAQSTKNNATISGITSRSKIISSSSLPTIGKDSLVSTTSVNSGSTIGTVRSNMRHTKALTIQIPNDKIQADAISLTSSSLKNKNTECTEISSNDRKNVGVLRILTKEQLNNRFVKIQVERGPTGRRVTVGSTTNSRNCNTTIDSTVSRTLPGVSDNKIKQTVFCDSSLSFNDDNETVRIDNFCSTNVFEKNRSVTKSEASTLVLSRSETDDSTASTLILTPEDSDIRDNLETTSLSISDGEGPSNPRSKQAKGQVKEVWEKIRSDVKNELKVLGELSASEQEKMLLDAQENLVGQRNMVLEDLTEMSGCLRQWEFERDIQTKLIAEVRRLREQLKTAEDTLYEQRRQMNGIGPRVTRTQEKINHGRRECYKLSRICQGLGTRVIGQSYKVPNTGARLLNERLKEVASHTRQLSKKKVTAINNSLSDARDVISSSPVIIAEPTKTINSMSPMRDTVNRMDTPSTSTSETENEDDDDEDEGPTRENESCCNVTIGETSESSRARELEESAKVFASADPPDERKPQYNEKEVSSLIESNDASIEMEATCSSEIHASTEAIEASSLHERNCPSEEMQVSPSLAEINVASKEILVSSLPEINPSTSETQVSNLSETNVPSEETELARLTKINEQSRKSENSSTSVMKDPSKKTESSRSSVDNTTTMKNSLSLDTVENHNFANSTKTSMSEEMNLISFVQDENHTEDNLSMPGSSRSDSPMFRLLNDSQPTGKQNLDRYSSVLAHFKTPRNVNPNGILCPYELMGTCNDGDCQYYHLDPDRQCQ